MAKRSTKTTQMRPLLQAPDTHEKLVGSDSRKPLQPRSQASLDRMMATARKLMVERRSEEFTLQEVSLHGKVSIGSIYHRFQSKDDLVRAVIGQALNDMAHDEQQALIATLEANERLEDYIPAYVQTFGEILRNHSLMLRLAMRRAATDKDVSHSGELHEEAAAHRLMAGLMHFRDRIPGDIDTRAKIAFHLIFATIARHLSLDSHDPLTIRADWDMLVREMSRMVTAYMTAPADEE